MPDALGSGQNLTWKPFVKSDLEASSRMSSEMSWRTDWPTMVLWCGVVLIWCLSLYWLYETSPLLAVPLCTLALVLHSSLSHEVLHGHPFRSSWASQALVVVNPGFSFPISDFATRISRIIRTHV